jgi:hypothetical protein
MRILLDESLPRRLRTEIIGHSVKTVADMGWSALQNGALLRRATADFDVFVTADQNLQYQQNLAALPLAVVVVISRTNRFDDIVRLVPRLLQCLAAIEPGTLVRIGD